MDKRWKIVCVCLLFVSIITGLTDEKHVSEGKDPLYTYKVSNNTNVYYIGLFYYYKGDIRVSPSQPYGSASNRKVGIWFLPGLKID